MTIEENYVKKTVYSIKISILDMQAKCPYCKNIQKNKPKKTWTYKMGRKRIKKKIESVPLVNCSYYSCVCGKGFTYYSARHGKEWTIPKIKN